LRKIIAIVWSSGGFSGDVAQANKKLDAAVASNLSTQQTLLTFNYIYIYIFTCRAELRNPSKSGSEISFLKLRVHSCDVYFEFLLNLKHYPVLSYPLLPLSPKDTSNER
jgi:hypothetical protein